jgi:glycine betaine catabolism A
VSALLDRAALERCVAPLGEARMLPADAYVRDDVLAWERRHLFEAGWVAVARMAELRSTGAQVAAPVGRGSVVVVRDGADVRGFANVCRHRGHELLGVGDFGTAATLRCPYHAWVYDLDGTLRAATGGVEADPSELALAAVRVVAHSGFVFANADGAAPPVTEVYSGLEALLGPYEIHDLDLAARRVYEVAANWKIVHENYQECLHCPRIHPELCRVSPPDSSDNLPAGPGWVGGFMDLAPDAATMSITGAAVAAPLPALTPRARRRVAYVALLPSLLVSAHPDYVLTHRLEPLAPDRTRVTCEWLARPDATIDGAVELWDVTNREDWAACESVQRGVASGAYAPGPLSGREDAVHAVVGWCARAYLDEGASSS